MTPEQTSRIEHNIDQLFDKVNKLGEGQAQIAVLLPRIEKSLEQLPCAAHMEKISSVEKEVYADTKAKFKIANGAALIAALLSIVALLTQLGGCRP